MRLENVELNNFKAIESAKIELQGKSSVIFGINGTGKSSILHAINLLYANIKQFVCKLTDFVRKSKIE